MSQPRRWFCGGSRECMGRGVLAIGASREKGFSHFWERRARHWKGGLGGKQGLTLEGWARGEGLWIHRSRRRGGSLEGNMCSTTTGIPRGRVENTAWAVRGRNKVSTVRRRGRTSLPYSPRLPAKPSILRGKRRARGSAGRALHSADRQSGRRWAWPARSFSHPARLAASAPVVRLCVGPSVRLGVPSRGRQGHFPVRLRAAPLLRLANLPPRQQPRAPRRAPPPRPRTAIAPPPRTPSRFRLRLPRDDTEAGSWRPFLLTLSGPGIPTVSLRTGGCACAVSLLRTYDLSLEAGCKWVGIKEGPPAWDPGERILSLRGPWGDQVRSNPRPQPGDGHSVYTARTLKRRLSAGKDPFCPSWMKDK